MLTRSEPTRRVAEGERRTSAETPHLARHVPDSMPLPDDANDPQDERLVNGVVVLIVSSVLGFCAAIFAAVIGSGVLTTLLVYIGVSVAMSGAILTVSLLGQGSSKNNRETGPDDALIEDEATKVLQAIYRLNRQIRFRFWLVLVVVISSVLATDHWAVLSGVAVCSVVALLWSLHSRQRLLAIQK